MKPKSKKSAKRDIEMLFEIGTLRFVTRVWKQFLNPHASNCSEHMFRVIWLALTLAKMEGKGDHEKIIKMAMVHDVAESRTGDVHYISRQYTKRDDMEAVKDIFEGTVHESEMAAIVAEYEKRQNIESKIVKDADNIDVQLELAELHAMGTSLGNLWSKTRKTFVYPKLYTKSAKLLWNEIAKAEPHDWHHISKNNRFYSGDWKKK